MKTGRLDPGYFRDKFGVELGERFAAPLAELEQTGMLELEGEIRLTRDGLLRVDSLLPAFYAEEYRNARYT